MPCMRDYGKTWDYINGYYPVERSITVLTINEMRDPFLVTRLNPPLPKYRKVANQHGVIGFRKL